MITTTENKPAHVKMHEVLNGLNKDGYILLEEFPESEILHLLESIGTIFKQDSGLQHDVKYENGFDDYRYSKSLNEIGPHTEFPYYDAPPRIQTLYCVSPAACGGGQTYLCSVKKFLRQLSSEQWDILYTHFIDFSANKDLEGLERKNAKFPLLQQTNDSFIFRFSHNLLYFGDVNAKVIDDPKIMLNQNRGLEEIVESLLRFVNEERIEWTIPKHGFLLWHNHSVVHWRNSYQDKKRHLVRYLLH